MSQRLFRGPQRGPQPQPNVDFVCEIYVGLNAAEQKTATRFRQILNLAIPDFPLSTLIDALILKFEFTAEQIAKSKRFKATSQK